MTTPQLPPQLEALRSQTADSVIQDLSRTPLFMQSLDEDDSNNPEIEALRALQYEGTPYENALNFKTQGNELVQTKLWGDAKEYYTKALLVLKKPGEESDAKQEGSLRMTCLLNRALCNLKLKNYRATYLDCYAVLQTDLSNIKACFRAGTALAALARNEDAMKFVNLGLAADRDNKDLLELLQELQTQATRISRKAIKQEEERKHINDVARALQDAFRDRKIGVRQSTNPPDLEGIKPFLAPDQLDSVGSTLHVPVSIVYPADDEFDLIKAVAESDSMRVHLENVLPERWPDRQDEYAVSNVVLYLPTTQGGLVKLGKNVALGKALTTAPAEVLDGMVQVMVVPKDKAEAFVEKFKVERANRVG